MDDTFDKGQDKRFFIRMEIDTEAFYQLDDESTQHRCTCRDLSAAGMSLTTESQVAVGTHLSVLVPSNVAGFEDLNAKAEVMRCQQQDDGHFVLGIKVIETI